MNKRIGAALCTVTAMAAVLALPTAAQAADPHPEFSTSERDEVLTLYFDTNKRPENLKVHLRKKGTAQRVLTVTDFTAEYPPPCEPSCADDLPPAYTTAPLKLPALGEYSVDVEYAGTQGEVLLHKDRTTMNYQVRPVFSDVKTSKAAVSLIDLDTVVSGDIKLYDPRDSSLKPFAGAAFTARTGTVTTALTTDAEGHFDSEVTVSRDGARGNGAGVLFAAETNGVEKTHDLRLGITPMATRIAMDTTSVAGPFGTRASVGGTLKFASAPGMWTPVPSGTRVHLDDRVGGSFGTTVHTDGSGRFTASGDLRSDNTWRVSEESPWTKAADQFITVDTTAVTALTAFKAGVDPYKNVSVSGTFSRYAIPAGTTSLKVEVQHSADGKTGWTTRKTVDVATKPANNLAAKVETTLPYPGPGHFRLQYAGTPDIPAATTPAVKAARTMTAIPEFNAAPEPVKKGQLIKVTGKLNHADPAWKPFAGQTITYYFRRAGSTGATDYKVMGTSKTAAGGTFTRSFKADVTGTWYAWYAQADANHFIASSRKDEVVVTP